MSFFANLLRILDLSMETPQPYGWFHLLSLAITVGLTVFLCLRYRKNPTRVEPKRFVLWISVLALLFEVYKQVNYSFSYTDGVVFDFQWYAFPFQFCSMPMYVGLLAGMVKKGKLYNMLAAFLATYAVFGGFCVMLYPVQVFISTIGINIQTMFCHGAMIVTGIYLLYTGEVKLSHKTILRAFPVFAVVVAMAMGMNEIAHLSGLLERETFNMFFISPYCEPSLPVYSLVQQTVPYPWCLLLYLAGFTIASYLVTLIFMGTRGIYRRLAVKKS